MGASVAVELGLGGVSSGTVKLADPCASKPAVEGGGIDGEVQRFALSGLFLRRISRAAAA